MENSNSNKKSQKWLWLIIAAVVLVALIAWCVISANNANGAESTFKFSTTFVMFTLIFFILGLGYLLGGIDIKGVSLGTAGVFLVAILFGWLCTLDFENVPLLNAFHMASTEVTVVKYLKGPVQNLGLILFVGAVGFIAGPNFFKNLAKNFKTYILLGAVIIVSGVFVAVLCALLTPQYGPEYWAGILSGALTSTPGFSSAVDAATENLARITLGHAIAYPFGVVGVVLFVQLMPKFLKADMEKERELLKLGAEENARDYSNYYACEEFGFMPFGLAVIAGLVLGSINIPLTAEGYAGPCFSLGTTGGVLIMCLVFGHFGHIGKLSLEVKAGTLKVLREFGLALFLIGAGFEGGVALVQEISNAGGAGIVIWGFIGGAVMTVFPMVIGFIVGKYALKLPLLNSLGSITGGMTSTPALGTLIATAETDDVASAYASTYPIALILIVLASQLMITLM